jgi:hypothetical protein
MVASGLVAGPTTGPVSLRATSGPLQDTEPTAVIPTPAALSYTVSPSVGGQTQSFTITNTGGTAYTGDFTASTTLFVFPTATSPWAISYAGQTDHADKVLRIQLKKYQSEATISNVTIPPGATITVDFIWDDAATAQYPPTEQGYKLILFTPGATVLTPVGNEVLDQPAKVA